VASPAGPAPTIATSYTLSASNGAGSQAARELGLAGIAQHLPARADHDRLLAIDAEALEQRLRVGVGVRIEPLVRVAVAPRRFSTAARRRDRRDR
jgi:hypothetical protein